MADIANKVELIVPTSTNVLNMVVENGISNYSKTQDSNIELPDLYSLAFKIVNSGAPIPVIRNGDLESL